jgi:hypothetical protein
MVEVAASMAEAESVSVVASVAVADGTFGMAAGTITALARAGV